MSPPFALFFIYLPKRQTDVKVPLSQEEYNSISIIEESPRDFFATKIEETLDIIESGGIPIYHPVFSKVILRTIISDSLLPKKTLVAVLPQLSSQRAFYQFMQLIGSEPQPRKELAQKLTSLYDTLSRPEIEFIRDEISHLIGASPNMDDIDPNIQTIINKFDGNDAFMRRIYLANQLIMNI